MNKWRNEEMNKWMSRRPTPNYDYYDYYYDEYYDADYYEDYYEVYIFNIIYLI